jgi:hypothetical protein
LHRAAIGDHADALNRADNGASIEDLDNRHRGPAVGCLTCYDRNWRRVSTIWRFGTDNNR